MRISAVGNWDHEAEEVDVTLEDGSTITLDMPALQAITDAMYQSGEKIGFDRPNGVYPVSQWSVIPAGPSLVFAFRTAEGQSANFEFRTFASESQVTSSAEAIQRELRDLFQPRQ